MQFKRVFVVALYLENIPLISIFLMLHQCLIMKGE